MARTLLLLEPSEQGRGERWVCAEHCLQTRTLPLDDLYSFPARLGEFAHLTNEETEARQRAVVQLGPGWEDGPQHLGSLPT